MGRWEPNTRGRLEQAALELYGERGFENTTVAEIAKRAGLTERTFFRYFSDKREVLFAGSRMLQDALAKAVADAPESATPIDIVTATLVSIGSLFAERHDSSRQRQAVIDANAELRERELVKVATLSSTLADALRGRGVGEPAASLAADAGIAAFNVAFQRWITEPGQPDLARLTRESIDELKAVTAGR